MKVFGALDAVETRVMVAFCQCTHGSSISLSTLNENIEFDSPRAIGKALRANDAHRFCVFAHANLDGSCEGEYQNCTFAQLEWYWSLFNCAVFVGCKFDACTFLGTTFASCCFVECTFNNCKFAANNLGGPCVAPESRFYGCTWADCLGWDDILINASQAQVRQPH